MTKCLVLALSASIATALLLTSAPLRAEEGDSETPSYNLPLNALENPQPAATPLTGKAAKAKLLAGHSPAPAAPLMKAPELVRALLPLDSLAAAICSNICTAPLLPFNGIVLLKACEAAITPAGGTEALLKLTAKSPELAQAIDETLESVDVHGGLKPLLETKRISADLLKPRSCAAGALFAIIAGARNAGSSRVRESDFTCLKGGLTDGGCNYTTNQLNAEPDAKILFGSGTDRATGSYFPRMDGKVLAAKLMAKEPPTAGIDYLAESQEGEFGDKYKKLFTWGRDHAQEVFSQLRAAH